LPSTTLFRSTGKTPGQLGIYGFRNRKDNSYEGLSIATSNAVKEPAVWDLLGQKGLRSLLIGVPPSYPPQRIEGWRVGVFLTPPSNKGSKHPAPPPPPPPPQSPSRAGALGVSSPPPPTRGTPIPPSSSPKSRRSWVGPVSTSSTSRTSGSRAWSSFSIRCSR